MVPSLSTVTPRASPFIISAFVLTDQMQIKKLAFLDGVFEGRQAKKDEAFDADAAIATGELAPLLGDLIDALCGEDLGIGSSPAAQQPPQAKPQAVLVNETKSAATAPADAEVAETPPWA